VSRRRFIRTIASPNEDKIRTRAALSSDARRSDIEVSIILRRMIRSPAALTQTTSCIEITKAEEQMQEASEPRGTLIPGAL
jgi:hypothetical protein